MKIFNEILLWRENILFIHPNKGPIIDVYLYGSKKTDLTSPAQKSNFWKRHHENWSCDKYCFQIEEIKFKAQYCDVIVELIVISNLVKTDGQKSDW